MSEKVGLRPCRAGGVRCELEVRNNQKVNNRNGDCNCEHLSRLSTITATEEVELL